MHQISFNTNHDFAPSVLANGQIVFSRWEATNGDQISLYRANPDGTGLELLYGANSHATGANIAGTNTNVIQFLGARQRADGKLLAIARPFLGTQLGGDLVLIDARTSSRSTSRARPSGVAGTAQTEATTLGVTTDANMPSMGGRFASLYPLYDGTNRMLVSWSPCLVQLTGGTTAVCNTSNTRRRQCDARASAIHALGLRLRCRHLEPDVERRCGHRDRRAGAFCRPARPPPTFIPDFMPTTTAQQDLVTNSVGVLDISSVYDFDGVDTAKPNIATQANPAQASFYTRPARFVRIEKAVEIPDKTVRKINALRIRTRRHGHARNPGLRTGSARRVGADPGAGERSVHDRHPRCERAAHHGPAHELAAAAAGGDQILQRLPHGQRNHTRPSHGRSGLTLPVNPGATTTGSPFPSTNPRSVRECRARPWRRPWRASAARRAAPLPCSQLLATRRDLHECLDHRRHAACGRCRHGLLVHVRRRHRRPRIAADQRQLFCAGWSAQCRITIHYANAASPNLLYLQNLWRSAVAGRDRERRRKHTGDLHLVPQHRQREEPATSARGSARLDRQCHRASTRRSSHLTSMYCSLTTSRRLIWGRCRIDGELRARRRQCRCCGADGGRKRRRIDGVLADVRWKFSGPGTRSHRLFDGRGVAFDFRMVGHRRPVLQRSVCCARSELT